MAISGEDNADSAVAGRLIAMNFVSIRIITGDVARLAGSCEKTAGVREGKKEGGKQ